MTGKHLSLRENFPWRADATTQESDSLIVRFISFSVCALFSQQNISSLLLPTLSNNVRACSLEPEKLQFISEFYCTNHRTAHVRCYEPVAQNTTRRNWFTPLSTIRFLIALGFAFCLFALVEHEIGKMIQSTTCEVATWHYLGCSYLFTALHTSSSCPSDISNGQVRTSLVIAN